MQELVLWLGPNAVAVVFAVTLAARAGAPLPAAPLLVVAGALAAVGRLPLAAIVVASVLANLAGDALWFAAGRHYGRRVLRVLCRLSLSPDTCVRQSESIFARWGASSLAAAKFVPGVSVVAAPMAGALGMSWPRFVMLDTVASLAWTAAFLALGIVLRDQIEVALVLLARAGGAAVVLLAMALAAWLAWRWWRRRRLMRHAAVPRIAVAELERLMGGEPPPVVIDVRASSGVQLDGRRIPGARLITLAQMDRMAADLPVGREIVVYCDCPNEVSAALGALALARHGHLNARPLAGGLQAWIAAALPTEPA